jgi:hypothetical protein
MKKNGKIFLFYMFTFLITAHFLLRADMPTPYAPSTNTFETRVTQPYLTTPAFNFHIFSKRKHCADICSGIVPCGYFQATLIQNFNKGFFASGEFDYMFYDPEFAAFKSAVIGLGYTFTCETFELIDFIDCMVQPSLNIQPHMTTPSLLVLLNYGIFNSITAELLCAVYAQSLEYKRIYTFGPGIKFDHFLDTFSCGINYARTIFKNPEHSDTSNTTTMFFEYDRASSDKPYLPVFNLSITFFSSNQPCYAGIDTTLGCGCNIEWCF